MKRAFLAGVLVGFLSAFGAAWVIQSYEEITDTAVIPPSHRQWGD